MRFKHLASAFLLAVGLALSAPAALSHLGVQETMATVSAAEGWNKDAKGKYYIKDGEKLTGMHQIGSQAFYFDSNGYHKTGTVIIGDVAYYFRPDSGALATGLDGLRRFEFDPDICYYFNKAQNGSVAVSQWVNVGGKQYYADAAGQIKFGTIKVDKKLYHITESGRMTSYGKSSYDKKYYYAGADGVLKTKLQKIGEKMYYFNPKTGRRQTGSVKQGKYYYYFNKSGVAKKGWVSQKDSDGKKQYYYYGSNYRRLTGFQKIKGKTYYLNSKKNGARATYGWHKIGKHFYYFSSKGVLQTGFVKVDGKTYYCSASGVRKKGWQTVDNRKYYMDKKTAVVKTGWFTYKSKKYYLNPVKTSSTYGAAKTGWVKIKGSWYFFNDDGTMRTGWLINNMKRYYLDPKTGKMTTGRKTINGTTYNFGTSGKLSMDLSGEWRVEVNRKQCFIAVYRGSTPIKAFICSTARDGVSTPVGTFRILDKLRWHELIGPSWGQYCSHITSDILFHSVPNMEYRNPHSLNASAFNMLGKPASAGCIRLSVEHAKWLYDNVPVGSKVVVSDSIAKPKYVNIETTPKIPLTQNYDPTDPNI